MGFLFFLGVPISSSTASIFLFGFLGPAAPQDLIYSQPYPQEWLGKAPSLIKRLHLLLAAIFLVSVFEHNSTTKMKLFLRICTPFWISQFAFVAQAQSFLNAISTYPQLSNFTSLLTTNPGLASSLLSPSPSAPQTVLVPDNNAFLSFQTSTGQSFSNQSQDYLMAVGQYHILNGNLTSQDFLHAEGITVPTGLMGPTYDNRTAGDALLSSGATTGNHDGQVVFIAPNTTSASFSKRQLGSPAAYVQSGLGHQVNLTAIDGVWDGGAFQIVDGYIK
jgi:hypothetical protein